MANLYTSRVSAISGEAGDEADDSDDGVFGSVAADFWSLIVASSVLAASVVIWEACAFAAMAALLAAGASWGLSFVAAAGWRSASRAAGTEDDPAAAARGLAEAEIRALPASPYDDEHRRDGPAASAAVGATPTCSVCLEEVRGGEMVRSLPECRHVFHVGCIDAWLQWHVTCPLCRSDLSPRRRATVAAVAGLHDASPSPRGEI
ncbi:unnamed protein product [Urochloa humidicola]